MRRWARPARTSPPAKARRARSARVVRARQATGAEPLTFSTVYAFSTHTYMLRHLLAAGGLDPDRDVRLVVVPPPYTAESLRSGLIHGFCVGSPWNSVAVEAGVGRIALLGSEIFGWAPEKVLAVHARFANAEPEVLHRLVRALDAAARWCETADALDELARLLAEPRHLGLPADMLRRALQGRLNTTNGGAPRSDAAFLVMHRNGANRPEPAHALWIYAQMVRAGQIEFTRDAAHAAMEVYRPGLYDAAAGNAGRLPRTPTRCARASACRSRRTMSRAIWSAGARTVEPSPSPPALHHRHPGRQRRLRGEPGSRESPAQHLLRSRIGRAGRPG